MHLSYHLGKTAAICSLAIMALLAASPSGAGRAADFMQIPSWLKENVGEGEGQIASVVLQRARGLYLKKVSEGIVQNPCYFAMDATRPNDLNDGRPGRRFYVICESKRQFHSISAGHGVGRDLKGIADFSNGRRCAKNFGNAADSKLTAGGDYVTAETKTSFKGYYRVSGQHSEILVRSFIQFDGEGDTANAREREIGGHAAVLLRRVCLRKERGSPYANQDGYVPSGELVEYAGGRIDGCTSWSASDAQEILAIVKHDPTTLYIYPQAGDVSAVSGAVAAHQSLSAAGLYWNEACLRQIGSPKFWSKETLGPILVEYKKAHPEGPERPTPICKDEGRVEPKAALRFPSLKRQLPPSTNRSSG
jgi:hypothetical protein